MKKLLIILTLTLLTSVWLSADWEQAYKALADDGVAGDNFGVSVSISGDYAIVGAHDDDDNADNSGSAYIFHRSGTVWSQQAKLTAADGDAMDSFGYSVSISGDYAVVGAFGDDDNGNLSGSAYIFHRSETDWSQQAKLTASDGATDDNFGYSVSISGEYAIIGAFFNEANGVRSGSSYIFYRNETVWTQAGKLAPEDGNHGDNFGYSVSISGDDAIAGAWGDDVNGDFSGSAYMFHRSGTVWTQQTQLTAADGAAYDMFGHSVSISGDDAIVGAFGDEDNDVISGSSYVFHRIGTAWTQQAKLTADDGADEDLFGYSVSISGDYAVVGASCDDDNGNLSGSAYMFHRSGTVWSQQAKLTADDGAIGDLFGHTVSISGDYAVVGAFHDDDNGDNSGSAYLFEYSDVAIDEDTIPGIPAGTALQAAFPNPFNPSTTVAYSLAEEATVRLSVYNLRGRRVQVLDKGLRSAGEHRVVWDGLDSQGEPASSGVYLFRLETGGEVYLRKGILMK
ncbi:MAG: T9SS type A sorting domain-containing protein [Candidatus Cloacimonetes bacterium]|nr:T9SS type A sorting domain-containing protein [Candidatus Cloacimonadota bacterium]